MSISIVVCVTEPADRGQALILKYRRVSLKLIAGLEHLCYYIIGKLFFSYFTNFILPGIVFDSLLYFEESIFLIYSY
jgi:hypothetical protein